MKEEVDCLNAVISSNISDLTEHLNIIQSEYDNLHALHTDLQNQFDNLKAEYDQFTNKHDQDLVALRNELTGMIVSFYGFHYLRAS